MALLLGYDVGSSSIKATLMDAETGKVLAAATSPDTELEIVAKQLGWAEQDPAVWWEHVKTATKKIQSLAEFDAGDVHAIGISYQMHGLVVVDKNNIKSIVSELIYQPEVRNELGRKGRKWVRSYHDPKNVLKKIHHLAGYKKNAGSNSSVYPQQYLS